MIDFNNDLDVDRVAGPNLRQAFCKEAIKIVEYRESWILFKRSNIFNSILKKIKKLYLDYQASSQLRLRAHGVVVTYKKIRKNSKLQTSIS